MNWLTQGLYEAALMLWQTLWALVLGYTLSALLQVFVRQEQMTEHFGRASLRSMGWATFLGAVSSSCSYAATGAAKTAFKKGASLPVALAFMFASTNLVIELSAVLWVLMGRLFVLAEFVGAFVLIATMWALVRLTLPKGLEEEARQHSSDEESGMMACCAESEEDARSFREKIRSRGSWSAVGESFRMDVAMVWKEILIGFLIAGFLMALVPNAWWQTLFVSQAPSALRLLENAVVGPIIAMASFVCSVGNIPLASWLWSNGISFGGVVSFIYADLIILPIILIYRKYYGGKAAAYISAILFASMVAAGIAVDLLFSALGLIPPGPRPPSPMLMARFSWNYTTWLDLAALALAAWLLFGQARRADAGHAPGHAHGS
ncbi:MAG TPA: permease [Bryobacteraceae bacterium]|nr:permease [Bryobacteraceae bacterium]